MGQETHTGRTLLSVLVLDDGRGDLRATLGALTSERPDVEVLVVLRWPVTEAARTAAQGFPQLASAAPSPARRLNEGLSAATGRLLIVIRAGDVPRPGTIDGLAAELERAEAVVGRIAGGSEPLRDAWMGHPPPTAPHQPPRPLALRRTTAWELDGVDDRVWDLDVALDELLARVRAQGGCVAARHDLIADGAPTSFDGAVRRAVQSGRGAHARTLLAAVADGHTSAPARAARLALAAAEPLLHVAVAAGVRPLQPLRLQAAFARGRGLPALPIEPGARAGLLEPPLADRPAVAVVVPFAGEADDAARLVGALAEIDAGPDDEVVVVDNSRGAVVRPGGRVRVLRADGEWSSYHARTIGVQATTAPWLLFIDADCRPVPGLLGRYFAEAPSSTAGAVAGDVAEWPGGRSLVERYSAAVGVLRQSRSLADGARPFAVTANLLVRRDALTDVGGFAQGIRSGGDADLCFRLSDAGWEIEHRPHALVLHQHRATLGGLLRQYRRYGGGVAWLGTRHPGVDRDWFPSTRQIATSVLLALLAFRPAQATCRAITGLTILAARRSCAADNVAPGGAALSSTAARDPAAGAPL